MLDGIRVVVDSVYIAPGDIKALDIFDTVVGNILLKHSHLLISMDANSSLKQSGLSLTYCLMLFTAVLSVMLWLCAWFNICNVLVICFHFGLQLNCLWTKLWSSSTSAVCTVEMWNRHRFSASFSRCFRFNRRRTSLWSLSVSQTSSQFIWHVCEQEFNT